MSHFRQVPLPPVSTREEAFAAGHKFYYDGKSCKHGHHSARYVSTRGCLACIDAHRFVRTQDPFDSSRIQFDAKGIMRPRFWDAATLDACKAYVQKCIDEWPEAPPAPITVPFKVRMAYGYRLQLIEERKDMAGVVHELYGFMPNPAKPQMLTQRMIRTSSSPTATEVPLFSDAALRGAPWVYGDFGYGLGWYVVEDIDFAVFPLLDDRARGPATSLYGVDGSLGLMVA